MFETYHSQGQQWERPPNTRTLESIRFPVHTGVHCITDVRYQCAKRSGSSLSSTSYRSYEHCPYIPRARLFPLNLGRRRAQTAGGCLCGENSEPVPKSRLGDCSRPPAHSDARTPVVSPLRITHSATQCPTVPPGRAARAHILLIHILVAHIPPRAPTSSCAFQGYSIGPVTEGSRCDKPCHKCARILKASEPSTSISPAARHARYTPTRARFTCTPLYPISSFFATSNSSSP